MPIQTRSPGLRLIRQGAEEDVVRGLVPGEDRTAPPGVEIALPQCLPKSQDAVEGFQRHRRNLRIGRNGAVVRVVKQEREGSAFAPRPADPFHDGGFGPFVDDDDIRIRQRLLMVELRIIGNGFQTGEAFGKTRQNALSLIPHKIGAAPAVTRFQRQHSMPAPHQVAHDATQEMRIAMVPAGQEGMGIKDELHGHSAAVSRESDASA